MTKTVLVTNISEIQFVKISCKKCGYAMLLPVKKWIEAKIHQCPACSGRFPVEDIKDFVCSIKSLQSNLTNDKNFSGIKIEIETEDS